MQGMCLPNETIIIVWRIKVKRMTKIKIMTK